METSPWRQRKSSSSAKMDSATEILHGSPRRVKGKGRVVLQGNGVKPERARKSLNEKLDTVVLDSHTKDRRVNVNGGKGEEEMFLKDEDFGNESSPSRDASDELLKKLESLIKDRGRTTVRESNDNAEKDLTDTNRRLEGLVSENHKLRNSLVAKEKLVETLHEQNSRIESEFEALMRRLDSTEKENAFLRYEYHVLEKDLEVRTEEMEYVRRSIDSAHKQQLKSVNKIVELESECQRLRLLIRKKLPEATFLLQPKLRSEAEERKMEIRRRNANIQSGLATRDEYRDRKLQIDMLMEENKNLKEIILKKDTEVRDLSRGQKHKREIQGLGISPRDEKFKNFRVKRTSEMSVYMEDFAEMEKLSIVSTDKNPRGDEDDQPFDWLQAVLSAISRQERISKRSIRELLQDIKIALGCMDDEAFSSKDTENPEAESTPLCITWKSPDSGAMTKEEIKRHLGLGTPILTTDEEPLDRGKQDLQEQNKNLKDEVKDIDSESKELRIKLKESEEKIRGLEAEVKTLKESKDAIEAEMETEKLNKEDVDTELSVTRAKLNETQQKLSLLKVELDFRKSCCEELEGTCLELQLQLESVEKKDQMEKNKKSQNGWDVATASMKLAECQETIVNLRKQLKGLALSSNLSALSSETRSITKLSSKGSSLRDKMLLEDNTKRPQNNDTVHDDDADDDDGKNCNALIVYTPRVYSVMKDEEKRNEVTTMAVVKAHEKEGFGILRKLLFRKRRSTSKKCLALTL